MPTTTSEVRVAVVGLGAIGQQHAAIYSGTPGASLCAVVEPQEALRQEIGERYGCASYASLEEMLEAECADAVSLCTPDHMHYESARTILAAGVHLLVEKPITTDPAEADGLTLLSESMNLVIMPGQTLRFDPKYLHLRDAVSSGKIGSVQHGYLRRNNKLAVAERAGGRTSVAYFLGVHDIDALQWITAQRVERVHAMASSFTDPTGEQSLAILGTLQLSGGAVVQIESAWNLPASYATSLDAEFRLVGSQGTASAHAFDAGVHVTAESLQLPSMTSANIYGQHQGALANELGAFIRSIRTSSAPPVTMREAASAVKVVAAMHESLTTGSIVDVSDVATASSAVK